jgi:DNA-binding beta-propeller fold protein YncE
MRRSGRFYASWAVTVVGLIAVALAPATAQANRALLSEALLNTATPRVPPVGQIEGACGLAAAGEDLYVSDYYHRTIDAFKLSTPHGYLSQVILPGGGFTGNGINELDADCGLAVDSAGRLYANEWHEGVARYAPTALNPAPSFDAAAVTVDGGNATGVAVDAEDGRAYVVHRTYVAVYEPSGAPVEVGGQPLRIGQGSLQDAYGVAVWPAGGRVYAPDAGTDTVKVFKPAVDPSAPVANVSHAFTSLVDAAVAVDPTNGHLIVADNTQPGYEHPEATLQEFGSSGAFLGQLACHPVDGQPSGLAFDSAGDLYVTNGNGPGSNVVEYGPYTTAAVPTPSCAAVAATGGHGFAPGAEAFSAPSAATGGAGADPAATASETVQHGQVRVSFDAGLEPNGLPRHGTAGVRLSLSAGIAAVGGGEVPQLRDISIGFNRDGHLDPNALPACELSDVQPATTAAARAACGPSLVGQGTFSADVRLPEQSPFPSAGKVLAFNARY